MSRSRDSIILSLLLFSGCTVGPDFVRPEPPTAQQYNSGSELGVPGAVVPREWWKLFGSNHLEPLLAQALQNNLTLKAALATLRQSQSSLDAGNGVFYPQLNADLGATRSKTSPRSFGVSAPNSIFNLFTATGSLAYVLDVFGGERRAVEGLKAQLEYQRHSVLAAYLTLTGNLVNTALARAAYQAEVSATQEIIQLNNSEIAVTEAQVKAGTTPFATLLSLQTQLYTVESTLSPLQQKMDQSDHLIAVLSGQLPSERGPLELPFSEFVLPQNLPKILPSELVERRPDILESEAQLHVASAAVGVTTAALFPSFTLNGTYGFEATSSGNLFKSESSLWNIGGNLTAPIFRGGTLRSQKQEAVEAFQAALANYHQTVLLAMAQVADTLRAIEHDSENLKAQSQALAAADEAAKLIEVSYRAGTANYLQVLTANAQLLQAKLGVIQAKGQSLQDSVALFISLGGGWWNGDKNLILEIDEGQKKSQGL